MLQTGEVLGYTQSWPCQRLGEIRSVLQRHGRNRRTGNIHDEKRTKRKFRIGAGVIVQSNVLDKSGRYFFGPGAIEVKSLLRVFMGERNLFCKNCDLSIDQVIGLNNECPEPRQYSPLEKPANQVANKIYLFLPPLSITLITSVPSNMVPSVSSPPTITMTDLSMPRLA